MTAIFGVHLVPTVVSLTLGAIIGVLGIRALRARPLGVTSVGDEALLAERRH